VAAAGWSFVLAASRERVWLMPLVVLILALFLASLLPNPVFDGRTVSRRVAMRFQSMRRP
jgi:Zn-dependent protease